MKKSEAELARTLAVRAANAKAAEYEAAVHEWKSRAVRQAWEWCDSKAWRKKAGPQSPPMLPPPPDLRIKLDLDDGMEKP